MLPTPLTAPILVTGCRRSGTTFLTTILARHPALLVHPNEAQFFLELHQRFGKLITDLPKAIEHLTHHRYCADTVTAERLTHTYQNTQSITLAEFSQQYLTLWSGEAAQTRTLVFKHPALVFYLDLVFELFPHARIIHLVRDPHANIASQRLRWPRATLWECIGWWRDAARAGHALAEARPDICLELTYEELVSKPEASMKHLCQFLELPYTDTLLAFDFDQRILSPGETETKHLPAASPAKTDSWKQQFTNLEIALIEQECRNEMAWWQYECLHPHVPTRTLQARSLSEQAFYAFKTAIRIIKGTHWRG